MFSNKKGQCEALTVCLETGGQMVAWLEDQNASSLIPGQGNLVNKM